MKNNKEYRNAQYTATPDDMQIRGYALLFEEPTVLYEEDGIQYKEIIDQHALDGVDLSDVCLRYNHNDGHTILARTRGGSLSLSVDENGLYFEANLVNTQAAKDIYTLIKDGLISGCSFGFVVAKDSYDVQTHTRRILKFDKIFEISVVDLPAYDGATVSARDYFSAQCDAEEKAEYEAKKKRLYLLSLT